MKLGLMQAHHVSGKYTPGIDAYIIKNWGISSLSKIETDTGLNFFDLSRRAGYLKCNGGEEKKMSITDLTQLGKIIEESGCDIKTIVKSFPDKRINVLYSAIRQMQRLSEVPTMKEKKVLKEKESILKKRISKYLWSKEEDKRVIEYLKGKNITFDELCKKIPLRTRRSILWRCSVLFDRDSSITTRPSCLRSKRNNSSDKKPVVPAKTTNNTDPVENIINKEIQKEPLKETDFKSINLNPYIEWDLLKNDIIKTLSDINESICHVSKNYETNGFYIHLQLKKKKDNTDRDCF